MHPVITGDSLAFHTTDSALHGKHIVFESPRSPRESSLIPAAKICSGSSGDLAAIACWTRTHIPKE